MPDFRNQRGPGGNPKPGGYSQLPGLPNGYLANGYLDSHKNPFSELMSDWAKAIAGTLHQGRMATSQLRRFFGEVRRIEVKLDQVGDFDQVRPEVLKLVAYANDAVKKGKAPPVFLQFMEQNVKLAARGRDDFKKGFVNHFECIVGFFPKTRD